VKNGIEDILFFISLVPQAHALFPSFHASLNHDMACELSVTSATTALADVSQQHPI